ncbi:MAG: hypothetical protein M4579_001481 [Chaenotheca gracillima]|nr:MAG: hypothetical protein M4579_001481 [Chaenotheca gracillima]
MTPRIPPTLLNAAQDPVPHENPTNGVTKDAAQVLASCQKLRYQLRRQARENKIIPTSWLDNDPSGTYDPAAEEDLPSPRPKRKKSQDDRGGGVRQGKRPMPNGPDGFRWEGGRRSGSKLVTKLEPPGDQTKLFLSFFADLGDAQSLASEDNGSLPAPEAKATLIDIGSDRSHLPSNHLNRKRACDSCQEARARCSYRDGGDPSRPCARCQRNDIDCLAKPEIQASTPSETGNPAGLQPTPVRPILTCIPCRSSKSWCSLQNRRQTPPCSSCLRQNIECSFEKVPETTKEPGKETPKQASSPIALENPTPVGPSLLSESSLTPVQPSRRAASTATATASRPQAPYIYFNYRPHDADSQPCNWCFAPSFGLLGEGRPPVDLMTSGDVVSGGFVVNNEKPARMCIECTTQRLDIYACGSHQIRPIPGLRSDHFDFEAAFANLVLGRQQEVDELDTLWCSLCPSPAFSECVVPRPDDKNEYIGCGLLLCEGCAEILEGQCKGNLDLMLNAIMGREEHEGEYPVGLRFDVRLLRQDGQLIQTILWQ